MKKKLSANNHIETRNISSSNFSGSYYVHLTWGEGGGRARGRLEAMTLSHFFKFQEQLFQKFISIKKIKFKKYLSRLYSNKHSFDFKKCFFVNHLLFLFIKGQR